MASAHGSHPTIRLRSDRSRMGSSIRTVYGVRTLAMTERGPFRCETLSRAATL